MSFETVLGEFDSQEDPRAGEVLRELRRRRADLIPTVVSRSNNTFADATRY
jgi:hypothetical protein